MERPKFKDAFKVLDFFSPALRSPVVRKRLLRFGGLGAVGAGGIGVGAGAAHLPNNEKMASLDKAEQVYYKLCQNK